MENETKIPNPQAFPAMDMNNYKGIDRLELRHDGMTLMDYFAAHALPSRDMGVGHEAETARRIYAMAAAMLKERAI